jgi:outer membrane protein OmpA-like peptidoglycan-associated protein
MPMNRWIWLILAAVILVAIGWFVWPTANRTTEVPPTAQAPSVPPAQPTTKEAAGAGSAVQANEQKSTPGPAAQTAEKEATPAPAQSPAAPAGQTAEKETTPAPGRPTAAPAGQTAEKETAPAPAQPPAAPASQTAEKETTPAPGQPTAAPAGQTAEKETAPAPAQPPAAPAGQAAEKETAPADTEANRHANNKANTELAALQPGFVPKDLVAALNDSVVNFPSDSAEVPASMTDFLQKAAEDLKQLPKGHVVEIAGYTDNTGDQALNVALSQKRAEAVRQTLIKFGADPEMLIAKGYGSADPVASNDTPEGRRHNRRIDYHIVKTP